MRLRAAVWDIHHLPALYVKHLDAVLETFSCSAVQMVLDLTVEKLMNATVHTNTCRGGSLIWVHEGACKMSTHILTVTLTHGHHSQNAHTAHGIVHLHASLSISRAFAFLLSLYGPCGSKKQALCWFNAILFFKLSHNARHVPRRATYLEIVFFDVFYSRQLKSMITFMSWSQPRCCNAFLIKLRQCLSKR